MWWYDYWPIHGFFFGPIAMIVFAVVCMIMMMFMMRGGLMHRRRGGTALDILNERFARGEINQTEYEERRRTLEA